MYGGGGVECLGRRGGRLESSGDEGHAHYEICVSICCGCLLYFYMLVVRSL